MSRCTCERIPQSFAYSYLDRTKYWYCGHKRCNTKTPILTEANGDLIYPYDVVVLSLNGGDTLKVFCSEKCCALWLNSKDR